MVDFTRGLFNKLRTWKFHLNPITTTLFIWVSAKIIFIMGIGACVALAPDELNYLAAYNHYYHATQMHYLWSDASPSFLKIIYFPARIIEFLGINTLQALRIESILLTLMAAVLILKSIPEWTLKLNLLQNSIKAKWMIGLGLFIPSVLIWGSLNLRESFLFLNFHCCYLGSINYSEKKDS